VKIASLKTGVTDPRGSVRGGVVGAEHHGSRPRSRNPVGGRRASAEPPARKRQAAA
jgi:hypothetical protein